ncbi:MAG: hypothetical protein K2X93_19085 [Candidatus Obscuribacterales bacterium]|nr:hypothetical protein [Candidatus Obscuribacterales bacterium]
MTQFVASTRLRRGLLVAVIAVAGIAITVPYVQRQKEHRRLDAFVADRISQPEKSPIAIADDATLLQGGQPIYCSWMTSKVVQQGETQITLPWSGSLIFVCPGDNKVTFRDRFGLPCRSLEVTGSGRGIVFADGTLYLEGQANYNAKNCGRIVAESGVHVDARDSGTILARAGATFREFNTKAEYAAYSKQVELVEKLVLDNQSDITPIQVTDGSIRFNGEALDERWLGVVRPSATEHETNIYRGEPTVFTTQDGADVTLVINGGNDAKVKIAGRSKGVVLRDGTIWLIEGTAVSGENLDRVVLNPGLNMKLTSSVKPYKDSSNTKKAKPDEEVATTTTRIVSRSSR